MSKFSIIKIHSCNNRIFLFFSIIFLLFNLSFANDSLNIKPKRKIVFFNFGIGVGGSGGSEFLSIPLSFNYSYKNKIITSRFISMYEGPRTARYSENQLEPGKYLRDYALLYGFMTKENYACMSFSLGLSLVEYRKRGKLIGTRLLYGDVYEDIHENIEGITVGLPFEIQASTNYKIIGIGFYFFGNIYLKESYFGIALTVQFGRF